MKLAIHPQLALRTTSAAGIANRHARPPLLPDITVDHRPTYLNPRYHLHPWTMKSSKRAPASAMSTSSDSDITSDEESGVRGQTGKRGDINASRKKYLRRGGKHSDNNDDVESHPPCKKRRVTTSKGKIKTSEEEEGNKLSAFFGAPVDSPMETKTSSSEGGRRMSVFTLIILRKTVVPTWEGT